MVYIVTTGRLIRTHDTNHNIVGLPKRPIRSTAQAQGRDVDREIYGYQSGNCERLPSSGLWRRVVWYKSVEVGRSLWYPEDIDRTFPPPGNVGKFLPRHTVISVKTQHNVTSYHSKPTVRNSVLFKITSERPCVSKPSLSVWPAHYFFYLIPLNWIQCLWQTSDITFGTSYKPVPRPAQPVANQMGREALSWV